MSNLSKNTTSAKNIAFLGLLICALSQLVYSIYINELFNVAMSAICLVCLIIVKQQDVVEGYDIDKINNVLRNLIRGNFNVKIGDTKTQKFVCLADNLDRVIYDVQHFSGEVTMVMQKASEGDFRRRFSENKTFNSYFLIPGVKINKTLDILKKSLREAINITKEGETTQIETTNGTLKLFVNDLKEVDTQTQKQKEIVNEDFQKLEDGLDRILDLSKSIEAKSQKIIVHSIKVAMLSANSENNAEDMFDLTRAIKHLAEDADSQAKQIKENVTNCNMRGKTLELTFIDLLECGRLPNAM